MMKKILLGLCGLALIPSLAFGSNNTAVDVAVDSALEKFEEKRLTPLVLEEQAILIQSIIEAVNDILIRSTFPRGSLQVEVLGALQLGLQELLIEINLALDEAEMVTVDTETTATTNTTTTTTTNITTTQYGSFSETVVPFHTTTNIPLLVVGGTVSDAITNFRMTAQGEDILIKELSILINGSNDAYRAIESLALYDDDGNFIASEQVSSDEVTFNNLNLLVPQGSFDIYPVVEAQPIGYSLPGLANARFTLTLRVDDTEGQRSGKAVGVSNNLVSSKEVVITPVRADVHLNEQDGLLFLGDTDLVDLTITSVDHDNTSLTNQGRDVDTLIQQLQFRTFVGNISETSPPTFTIRRNSALNFDNNRVVGFWDSAADLVTFDLSPWADDNGIINGEVGFTVAVEDITETNPSSQSFINLILTAGNPNAVIFGTDDPAYGSFSLPLESDMNGGWKREQQ